MSRPGAFLSRPAPRTFIDRRDAGRALAALLSEYLPGSRYADRVVVLGLPRGGVPVAWEVAAALHAPLEALPVRKLGVPQQPELAMGALAGGQVVMNERVIVDLGIDNAAIQSVIDHETAELRRRHHAYLGDRPAVELRGRSVILVDDGIATGASVLAAVQAARAADPASIMVAVPVASRSACQRIAEQADEVCCAWLPEHFDAVGQAYLNFDQVGDDEVRELLSRPTTG